MDVNCLIALGVVAGILLTAGALIVISGRRTARKLKNSLAEMDEMRSALSTLRTAAADVKESATTPEPAARTFVPAPVLTADQRAGALEMLRKGADAAAVAATMGLSHPETALLLKVQRLLDSPSALG
jgi:Tfp pilus assembly protein PilX